jgi:copper resistance protein B
MKRALCLLLLPLAAHAAEHDHSAAAVPEPAPTEDHAAHMATAPDVVIEQDNSAAMQEARHMNMMMHGDSVNFLVLGDRLERSDDDTLQWDLQGWFGYDRDKLWLKTEGEHATDATAADHSEVQLLYSRAVTPYWDLQAGLRRVHLRSTLLRRDETRSYAVLGVQGLAPYWFDIDAAAFVSERGDLSARIEAEYELRFTQKLLLQPRVELDYSFADDPALAIGEWVSEAAFGLRLRYELRREFAPYLGVEWSRAFGNTADLLRAAGEERDETRVVAGLRFWY